MLRKNVRRYYLFVVLDLVRSRLLHSHVPDVDALVFLVVVLRVLAPELVEVLVVDGLLCCDPLIRVHLQQPLHQVNFDIIHDSGVAVFKRFRMRNIWELQTLESSVAAEFFLKEVRKWTKHFLNNVELINFRVSREQRLSIHKLAHNAPDGPDVNFLSIRQVVRNQKQFRRSVPPRGNVVGEFGTCILSSRVVVFVSTLALVTGLNSALLLANKPGEPEVADFELVGLGADEEVFRFDVPVHDVLRMEVLDCL